MGSTGGERHGDRDAPRVAWFVHGILGQGRNWRTFARRLVEATAGTDRAFQAFLPDLRGHGHAGRAAPPHTLRACVDDLLAELPPPDLVVGHSFGGKVAVRGFADDRFPAHTVGVVLDSPPAPLLDRTPRGPDDPLGLLPILRALPGEVADREVWRSALRAHGIGESLVQWLLTSAVQTEAGPARAWRWLWDFDVVEGLLDDYFATDFRPFLAGTPRDLVLVRAGRSDRWTDAELAAVRGPGVSAVTLAGAGHWVHVDDPDGTFAVVREAAARAGA